MNNDLVRHMQNIMVRLHRAASNCEPICRGAFENARGKAFRKVIRKLSDSFASQDGHTETWIRFAENMLPASE